MSSQIFSSNPVVKAVVEGTAPRPAQVAASRGALPLPQNDLLEILVAFSEGPDSELKQNAAATLRSQPADSLESTVRSADIAPRVLDYFARQTELPAKIHEAVILNERTSPSAIAEFAGRSQSGSLLELVSINQ